MMCTYGGLLAQSDATQQLVNLRGGKIEGRKLG